MLNEILKCVVFLGYHNKVQDRIVTIGTGFIGALERASDPTKGTSVRLITAKHVITQLSAKGAIEVFVRFNDMTASSFWRKTLIEDWDLPMQENLDVASYSAKLPAGLDHLGVSPPVLPAGGSTAPFAAELTDEVVIAGLFSPYQNEQRLTPLLRTANILSLADPNLPVSTPIGLLTAHLLEMKSVAGLSGAPVFMRAGLSHILAGKVASEGPHLYLLGLLSGHFVEKNIALTGGETDQERIDVNSGVAFVTPAEAVVQHLTDSTSSEGRTKLYFSINANLSEGSLLYALRYLPEQDIKQLSEIIPDIASLKIIDPANKNPPQLNAKSMARLFTLPNIVEKLKAAGWDGSLA